MTAIKFFDGFDMYNTTAEMIQRWTSQVGCEIGTAFGRNGGIGIQVDRCDFSATKIIPTPIQTHFIGFAFRTPAAGVGQTGEDYPVVHLADSAGGNYQVSLGLSLARKLQVRRNTNQYYNGTILATGNTVLSAGVWYYIEFKVKIHGSTGTVQVRLNGVDEIASTTGLNTQNTANANADTLQLSGGDSFGYVSWYDDVYWMDDSGTAPRDTFLGDVRIQALLPSGAGAHSQWTPSAGSNYQNVDDAAPNDDTDYNSDSTAGDRDTFAFGDLVPTTGTVLALQVHVWARKDDAGTRQIATVVRHSGTDYDGTTQSIGNTYTYWTQIYEQNPGTSADWTIANVNTDDEFGYKLVA